MTATQCRVCAAPTDAYLCRVCVRELRQAIAELPSDVTDLAAVMTRQASGPLGLGERRRQWEGPFEEGSLGDAPWEFAPGPADQLWAIGNTVTTWVRHLCETRRMRPPAMHHPNVKRSMRVWRNRMFVVIERYPIKSISPLTTWLVDNIDAVGMDEAAAQIFEEFTGLRTENNRWILGRSQIEEFLGYCDATQLTFVLDGDADLMPQAATCGVALYGRQGEAEARCSACGTRYDSAERHAQMWAREINDQLARPHAIADALTTKDEPLSPTLLRKWIQRDAEAERSAPTMVGVTCEDCAHRSCERLRRQSRRQPRILARGEDDEGKSLYRVGDVRDRLASVTAQRGAKLSA